MMTRLMSRTITTGGLALIGFVAMRVGLVAEDPEGFHCHDEASPAYCHWSDGSDCAGPQSMAADFCDGHGGVATESCSDGLGGLTECVS